MKFYPDRSTNHDKHYFSIFYDFLENCHDCLEIISVRYNSSIILKLILNYIKRSNNSLKILGLSKLKNGTDEELKLLNQIKNEGVKIVDYSSIFPTYCHLDNYISD